MDQIKTYSIAGLATNKKGKRSVKVTNDKNRVVRLERDGFTNVIFVDLPTKMTKDEAILHLKSIIIDDIFIE